jgi:hypothetical protein
MELPQVLPDAVQVVVPAPVVELTQQPPSAQKLLAQQGWFVPPHAVQVPPPKPVVVHVVSGAVQVELAQQLSPLPPQLPQAPSEQVPPIGHAAPVPTHRPFTQQPPSAQVLPSQHASPATPQVGTTLPPVPGVPPLPGDPPLPTEPPVAVAPPVPAKPPVPVAPLPAFPPASWTPPVAVTPPMPVAPPAIVSPPAPPLVSPPMPVAPPVPGEMIVVPPLPMPAPSKATPPVCATPLASPAVPPAPTRGTSAPPIPPEPEVTSLASSRLVANGPSGPRIPPAPLIPPPPLAPAAPSICTPDLPPVTPGEAVEPPSPVVLPPAPPEEAGPAPPLMARLVFRPALFVVQPSRNRDAITPVARPMVVSCHQVVILCLFMLLPPRMMALHSAPEPEDTRARIFASLQIVLEKTEASEKMPGAEQKKTPRRPAHPVLVELPSTAGPLLPTAHG